MSKGFSLVEQINGQTPLKEKGNPYGNPFVLRIVLLLHIIKSGKLNGCNPPLPKFILIILSIAFLNVSSVLKPS